MVEINITRLVTETDTWAFSGSVATHGSNAGRNTWSAAKQEAANAPLLTTEDQLAAMAMANNYTQFSFTVKASKDQAAWIESIVRACHAYQGGEGDDCEFDRVVIRILEGDLFPDVQIEFDDSELWFHADESGDIEFTANLIHEMLKHFNREDRLGFTWSQSCSKMRCDEFSGGAVFITKDDVQFISAVLWLGDKIRESQNIPIN